MRQSRVVFLVGVAAMLAVAISAWSSPVAGGAANATPVRKSAESPVAEGTIVAKVPAYTVAADLSNVVNRKQFGGFSKPAAKLLSQNGFVCLPTDDVQLYDVYEQNDYTLVPSFITTDSMLQIYHIFFDYTLRTTETEKLYPILENLTAAMLAQSLATERQAKDNAVKDAARRNVAYFVVPARVLRLKTPRISKEALALAGAELALIARHAGRTASPIFGHAMDYSQFIPRGHYTRTERFQRFFKAMMWYGLASFALPEVDSAGKMKWTPADKRLVRQALLMVTDLQAATYKRTPAATLWEAIYEPTKFYVGAADDLSANDLGPLMRKVYGAQPKPGAFADERKLEEFTRQALALRQPRIKTQMLGIPGGLQYRFMGQRYIPDSEMLQRLTHWPERPMPKGLDVFAVLGSDRAARILDDVYKEPAKWKLYLPERRKLRQEFAALDDKTWLSNLYYGWLWSLKPLLVEAPEGYPSFMRTTAWLDKSLNTSLASWAELRHDTILYAKQSAVECGGEEPPPPPKGYVEPNPEFYGRLLKLTRLSREGLAKRKLLSPRVQEKARSLEEMLDFLRRVSIKELRNQELTREEYDEIRIFGARLEGLTKSIAEGEILSETDKDMAVVADVHTAADRALEEGVGHAAEIYVVVPIGGKLYLTHGAVFTYFEFEWPAADRLTDEKWQGMVRGGKAASKPIWTKSFFGETKHSIPAPAKPYFSGC
jgi:hypothetical protein